MSKIKKARAIRGITQLELGDMTGMTRQKIQSIESGLTKFPQDKDKRTIARALKMKVEELFE